MMIEEYECYDCMGAEEVDGWSEELWLSWVEGCVHTIWDMRLAVGEELETILIICWDEEVQEIKLVLED